MTDQPDEIDDEADEADEINEADEADDETGGFVSVEEFFARSRADDDTPPGFRSGFVSLVGRPNVGKSTLINQILGHKVSIVSDKPQTTRTQIRGIYERDDVQVVFVDTPGIHKPRTLMGQRLNDTAIDAVGSGVDVVCLLVDATAPVGRGDAWVAERTPDDAVIIVNKCDLVDSDRVIDQLARASEFSGEAWFPISAKTGVGVTALVDHLIARMPEGPRWYPSGTLSDVEDAVWVAELVREQLLAVTREELPHSIACRVTEWEGNRIRVEILVERDSQKGMVIGKGGLVLKQVGTLARQSLPEGTFLDLHVRVDKDWQRRPASLDRLGY